MKTAFAFIDGFNMYHALDDNFENLKWLNVRALAENFIYPSETLTRVTFFTALPHWKPDSLKRHQTYLRALVHESVDIVHGRFKKTRRECPSCTAVIKQRVEKKTDVAIAAQLIEGAATDAFDIALLLSGDSDLIPAIEVIQRIKPGKIIRFIAPPNRNCNELIKVCGTGNSYAIKKSHLIASQFPPVIYPAVGSQIERPAEWPV